MTNTVFLQNTAGLRGGGVCIVNGSDYDEANNTYIGNIATTGGSAGYVSGSDFPSGAEADFESSVFAFQSGALAIDGDVDGGADISLRNSLFWSNTAGNSAVALDSASIEEDPGWTFVDASCDPSLYLPSWESGMRDGGRGRASRFDLYGSRNDMGFVGGPAADPAYWVDGDGDGFPILYDCDDANSDINPEADKLCDDAGVDENYNGLVNGDDPDVVDGEDLYVDADGDRFEQQAVTWCRHAPDEVVDNDDDCDDTNAALVEDRDWYADNDGDGLGAGDATSSCGPPDGFVDSDDDCDDTNGAVGATRTWYADNDGDGVGDAAVVLTQCDAPDGFVSVSGDCDDEDATVTDGFPWYADLDEDGLGAGAATIA